MDSAVGQIQFHYVDVYFYFPNRNRLKQFLLQKLSEKNRFIEAANFIFCTDKYLLAINKRYLRHDTFTDIVTFELSPKDTPLLADIFISIERVKENSASYKVSFTQELHRVIFHGILHLNGLNDKTKLASKKMRQMENLYLEQYFSRGTLPHKH